MSEEEIAQIIEQKVWKSLDGTLWEKPENLTRLVFPQKKPFLVDLDWNQSLDFWLIYEEMMDGTGFKIVFDDSNGKYGLAISLGVLNRELVLRFYESFQDALNELPQKDSEDL